MAFLRSALLTAFALLTTTASVGCGSDGFDDAQDEEDEEPGIVDDVSSIPTAAGPLKFADACRGGTQITIAAVGDVLLHGQLQQQAYTSREGHHSLWKGVAPLLAKADLTYANLEGPCADGHTTSGTSRDPGKVFDNRVYSGYPQFNYHPSLIPALKELGVDVVSTANNHALDRRGRGADRTIENLNEAGLAFTGTKASTNMSAPWHAMTEAKGIRVAWVACTFSTNGIPDPKNQVLSCYEDKSTLLGTIRSLRQDPNVDAVIVTPHWGVEYKHTPQSQEKQLAHDMIDAGALAVIGGHPHVVQPWEKYTAQDGREGFILYSLGNFVSAQRGTSKATSLVLYVGLTKSADGKVTVNGVRHVPIQMNANPWTAVPATGEGENLVTKMYGKWNRVGTDEPLVTNLADCGSGGLW